MVGARQGGLILECATISAPPPYGSPVIPWIQGEARRIGVLISNQRYTALPSPTIAKRATYLGLIPYRPQRH
ncbi:hypothetical protein QUF58_09185 [Anaerolineales bacterium HSG24]|nr:hypothetical protein [Anaerolineales bacterium HSG24]